MPYLKLAATYSIRSICRAIQRRGIQSTPPFCTSHLVSALTSSTILANPRSRLSLISRHLQQRPNLEINTPFSTERDSEPQDDIPYTPLIREPPDISKREKEKERQQQGRKAVKMSAQQEHPTLLIPGPIEFDDAVLQSMSHFRSVYSLFQYSATINISQASHMWVPASLGYSARHSACSVSSFKPRTLPHNPSSCPAQAL